MACTENVASEAYADFITRYYIPSRDFLNGYPTDCIDFVNEQFAVVYLPLEPLLPLTLSTYTYSGIPKLYSLLDSTSLEASGVDVQGAAVSGVLPTTRMTGTSVAAAHVAGAAAVLMSWGILEQNEPFMTTSVVKTYLTRGAQRNPAIPYPNREFGYGTLDLYQAFLSVRA